jgi:hypothetical protein
VKHQLAVMIVVDWSRYFKDCMPGQNYLEFLQNELPEQLEDVPLATQIAVYFQHDKAPFYYSQLVMKHLSDTFPN